MAAAPIPNPRPNAASASAEPSIAAAAAAAASETEPVTFLDPTIADASPDGWGEWEPDQFTTAPDTTVYVQVLHGYGRVRSTERHFIDEFEFVGGVCKKVPLKRAETWKAIPGFRIQILRDLDAGPAEYGKAAGVRPMDPRKLAAVLGASDINDLVNALGQDRTEQLLRALRDRLEERRTAAPRAGGR